jgi:2-dehydropantoate 2-reductase
MNIVIVGQGAIGLLWYSQLCLSLRSKNKQSSLNITLRPSHMSIDIPKTVSFTDINGKSTDLPLKIANDHELKIADVILICVKSYQVKQALSSISPFINNASHIVLSHNGMGTIDELPTRIIDNYNILALLITHGSLKTQPWKITHTGAGRCDLGIISLPNKQTIQNNVLQNQDKMASLTKILNHALPNIAFQTDIVEKQWLKLAINCVINPLTAIHNIENGQILLERFTKVIAEILAEVVVIARYQQVILDEEMLMANVLAVAKATEKNHSSMLCDVLARRETEIAYINGYIHKLGKKLNVSTPANTALWREVLQLAHD